MICIIDTNILRVCTIVLIPLNLISKKVLRFVIGYKVAQRIPGRLPPMAYFLQVLRDRNDHITNREFVISRFCRGTIYILLKRQRTAVSFFKISKSINTSNHGYCCCSTRSRQYH